MTTIKREK